MADLEKFHLLDASLKCGNAEKIWAMLENANRRELALGIARVAGENQISLHQKNQLRLKFLEFCGKFDGNLPREIALALVHDARPTWLS